MRYVALALGACLLSACSPGTAAHLNPSPSPSPSPSPIAALPSPSSVPVPPPEPIHIFVIVMENRSYSQVVGDPYLSRLAAQYAMATNYHGISHPSLPNYLALTSGSTWGIADDGFHALPAGGLGAQLTAAGIDWRAYMEGMSGGCFRSPYPYALKHNPFAYYGSACPAQVVPFTHFAADMQGQVPQFVWITPGLCHDGHDCPNAAADAWLAPTVSTILSTAAFQANGLLFITWDEGEDSANSVLTLVIHPRPLIQRSAKAYNHYSLLATIEDELQLPRLGLAARASPMSDLLAEQRPPRPHT